MKKLNYNGISEICFNYNQIGTKETIEALKVILVSRGVEHEELTYIKEYTIKNFEVLKFICRNLPDFIDMDDFITHIIIDLGVINSLNFELFIDNSIEYLKKYYDAQIEDGEIVTNKKIISSMIEGITKYDKNIISELYQQGKLYGHLVNINKFFSFIFNENIEFSRIDLQILIKNLSNDNKEHTKASFIKMLYRNSKLVELCKRLKTDSNFNKEFVKRIDSIELKNIEHKFYYNY